MLTFLSCVFFPIVQLGDFAMLLKAGMTVKQAVFYNFIR